MQISISCPDLTLSFTADTFNEQLVDVDVLCVTEMNFDQDIIIDHFFKEVDVVMTNTSVCFTSSNNVEKIGVFELVSFLNPNVDNFMGVFQYYDGEIICYNNKSVLTNQRELIQNPGSVTYIVTGYKVENSNRVICTRTNDEHLKSVSEEAKNVIVKKNKPNTKRRKPKWVKKNKPTTERRKPKWVKKNRL